MRPDLRSDELEPPCLGQVQGAADRLREALLSLPFPRFEKPKSDIELQRMVGQAQDWWDQLFAIHGGFADGRSPIDDSIRKCSPPDESLLWHFDPRFQSSRTSAIDPSPVIVLGKLPENLRAMPNVFHASATLFSSSPRFLPDEHGLARVPVVLENWPTVRMVLHGGHRMVTSHCRQLLQWVNERLKSARSQTVPTIRAISRGQYNKVAIVVEMCGRERHTELTNANFEMLRQLHQKGHVERPRNYLNRLLHELPELTGLVRRSAQLKAVAPEQNAVLEIDADARDALHLDTSQTW